LTVLSLIGRLLVLAPGKTYRPDAVSGYLVWIALDNCHHDWKSFRSADILLS
jgi:hypothetical protein